ncbi:MAG: hypothetical protein WCL50_19185, partial [Spirochaetota bacterium]
MGLANLGQFRLKDLSRAEILSQVRAEGLRDRFPPLKSMDGKPHNLPLEPTPFIGRTGEIVAIMKAFEDPDCRLLSVLGPGGVGKTRLAVQAGAELLDSFEGGVWFIDLSDSRNADSSVRALNGIMAVKERPGIGPLAALKELLGSRRILLILDNLEQDIGAARLVTELLSSCSGLSLLATSREALRIRWERQLQLSALALPGIGADPRSLSQYDAVRLFIERARAVRSSLVVDDRSAPAIAQICVHLEGIPLAIELAAARARAFSPDEILKRLEADLDFLDAQTADLPPRQHTLRAVADWSFKLLPKPEKAAFRALGVFSGSFSLESAEAVLSEAELGAKGRRRIPALLASLVDKSLVTFQEREEGSLYRLLETLRVYARERLAASSDFGAVDRAHGERYLVLARDGKSRDGRMLGESELYRVLDAEYPDYEAAWRGLGRRGLGLDALALATGLVSYWCARGSCEAGISLLSSSLGDLGPQPESPARVDALTALGELLRYKGDFAAAMERLDEAILAAGTLGDQERVAKARASRGWVCFRLG